MEHRNYLYHILIDGTRPFLYRNKVRLLLGIPDNHGSNLSFPPNLPPVGFHYVHHPLTGEFNLSYPDESQTSHSTGSLSHHDQHFQGAVYDEYKDVRHGKPEQRLSESDEPVQEEKNRNLKSAEEKYIHNRVSKPKSQESLTVKSEKDSTELNMPEIIGIERSKESQRTFAYRSVQNGETDLPNMTDPSEPPQIPSVRSKKKPLPEQEQQLPGISSELDIDIPGVSDRRLVFPLLSCTDEKKENPKRTGKTDQQTDRNEASASYNDELSKPVKTYQKSLIRNMSETLERDYREANEKKSFFLQNRPQGAGPVYRDSPQFPFLQEDVELKRKNRVYKEATKTTDHHAQEQRVVRKTSKKKHISQKNETQEVVIIRKESSPLASSYAFWERSYLSRFLLKYMR